MEAASCPWQPVPRAPQARRRPSRKQNTLPTSHGNPYLPLVELMWAIPRRRHGIANSQGDRLLPAPAPCNGSSSANVSADDRGRRQLALELSLAQLDAADLSRQRLRQLVDELDPPRIRVGRMMVAHVGLDVVRQGVRGSCPRPAPRRPSRPCRGARPARPRRPPRPPRDAPDTPTRPRTDRSGSRPR